MNSSALSDVVQPTRSAASDSRAWQIWGLIKQELLYLCWAIMDVAIMAPIAMTIMRWGRFWPPGLVTLWLLLLILLPFNLVRTLSAFQISERSQRRIIAVSLVVTLIVSWRGLLYAPRPLADIGWLGEFFGRVGESGDPQWARDLTLFLFVLAAWWRGLRLVRLTPDIHRVGLRLRAGGLLLAPIAFFLHVNGGLWSVTPFILLYFLAGLTAVSLVRAEQIEREHSGFAASLSPGWVASIFAASLLVVALAGLTAAIFSGDPALVLSGWLGPLWRALGVLATVAVSTFIHLLTPALNVLTISVSWLAALFEQLFSGVDLSLGLGTLTDLSDLQPVPIPAPEEAAGLFTIPDPISRSAIILLMLALAILIAAFLTRRFQRVEQVQRSGARTTAAAAAAEQAGLAERILGNLGLLRRWRTAASIRNIYARMCRAAAAVGYPRANVETPFEYLTSLATVWPENQDDYQLITAAFVRVRYGQVPESAEELAAIKAAWQRLERTQPAVADAA